MRSVHVVGCGALGSVFAVEMARRATSVDSLVEMHLYDMDNVEHPRNTICQAFGPEHRDMAKVTALGIILSEYDMVRTILRHGLVTEESIEEIDIDPDHIIIDAVDNLKTRRMLWQHGLIIGVPVLHMQMSQSGQGSVSWSLGQHDTYPFSPSRVSDEKVAEMTANPPEQLKPCELGRYRGLILNTALAGVEAVYSFWGEEPPFEIPESGEGTMAFWSSGFRSHALVPDLTFIPDKKIAREDGSLPEAVAKIGEKK